MYFEFLVFGIGTGAIIAALAIGLVLAYRASGVINLGHGAIAGYVAYTFASLRDTGAYPIIPLPNPLVIPEFVLDLFGAEVDLPNIPPFIQFGQPLSTGPAFVLAMVAAIILGLAAHFLVFRPLRYAPVLAKFVASVGIMLVLQSALVLRFGSRARAPGELLPSNLVSVFGARVPVNRLILLAIVIVLATSLWALFKFTRFGIATRAAAENERAVTFLGFSADFQAGVSWVLATMSAGLVGILVAPITGLTPARFTLLVIPALGAALLGGFSSFGIAAAAGLGIGMLQSEIFLVETRWSWFPQVNLQAALPFVVIVLALFLRGRSLPTREAIVASRLPQAHVEVFKPWLVLGLSAATLAGIVLLPFDYRDGLNNTMIGVIYALSLVVIVGYVGQISLVQSALAGLAAFGVATFSVEAGLPLPLAVLIALGVAIVSGVIVAIPALRTRGASLAIVTIASAVAIQEFFFKQQGWFGARTSKPVPDPSIFGIEFGPSSTFLVGDGKIPTPGFGIFLFVIMLLVCLAVMRLRRSALGERMLAVRANERAAAAAGINIQATKIVAFAISAFIAGIAGILYAFKVGSASAANFGVFTSLSILALAYLGGISTVTGAIWAGTLFTQSIAVVLSEEVIPLGRYTNYLAGVFVITTCIFNSEGIDGYNRKVTASVKRKWASRPRRTDTRREPTIDAAA